MIAQSRRERVREATIAEIKATARAQIDLEGAASLSLGGIAREMGLTTPALYRYFDNRDALVTALIVDAYHSLADALETAVATTTAADWNGRFRSLLLAYREWAIAHPADYTLMHGAPIAGYEAPAERIMPGAIRSLRAFADVLQAAETGGALNVPPAYRHPPRTLDTALAALQQALAEKAVSTPILTTSIMTWIRVHGLVWLELHDHLSSDLLRSGELYRMEVDIMAERLGLAG